MAFERPAALALLVVATGMGFAASASGAAAVPEEGCSVGDTAPSNCCAKAGPESCRSRAICVGDLSAGEPEGATYPLAGGASVTVGNERGWRPPGRLVAQLRQPVSAAPRSAPAMAGAHHPAHELLPRFG